MRGLGYNWTKDTIEYVIGLKEGEIEHANCSVILPYEGWLTIQGRTSDIGKIYEQIYLNGVLKREMKHFLIISNYNECEIKYYR